MDPRPYYSEGGASTAFYDLMAAADPAVAHDVDLYAALIPTGASVLELGSGTGRISSELARRDFDVVGLELSPAMLARAEAAKPGGVSLSYVEGDMRAFDLGRTFDVVICPYNALAHHSPTEWPAVFRCVAAHLNPEGVAAFHMPLDDQLAAPAPPPGSLVFKTDRPPLEVFIGGKRFDGGRMDLLLDYATPEEVRRERLTLYAGEPDAAAEAAGLRRELPPTQLASAGRVFIYRALR